MKNSWKPRFHEIEHESKMRLLKTHSHTSEWRGNEADRVRITTREMKEGLTVSDWKKSSTKGIAMPPETGGGRRSVDGKAKSEYQKGEEKIARNTSRAT